MAPEKSASPLHELLRLFLKLGIIGFGGPAVHIAMMEEEVVRKRKWMDHARFLDLVGATNLIPGPNSTEMAMHIGRERAGGKGLLIAGLSFIIPAVLITGCIAWAYALYGQLPSVQPFIYGIKPAIIAVVAMTMVHLGKKAISSALLALIGLLALAAVVAGMHEIVVLFASGIVGMLIVLMKKQQQLSGILPFSFLQAVAYDLPSSKIFLLFLKIGSILYGSGYVLFAFLDAELVEKGWFTQQVLTDAIAVGQFTPGPVFSSATFIGWQMNGFYGACAATAGIFLPAFVFVALLNPLVALLRKSPVMSAFLDAVNVASIAIIFAVMIEMGQQTLSDWRTVTIAITSAFVTFWFRKFNTAFIVAGGALMGYLLWQV